jgi:tripartite-type tricarboxylate transporter receptor subunit TctC
MAGINIVHIPYRGGGEGMIAVMTGEASVHFAPLATALPLIQQGRLRVLAVTTARRIPMMPDLPTIAESGFSGYALNNWYGLMVPAKTPRELIATIRGAAITALNLPGVTRRFVDLGYTAVGDQPEEFAAHIRSEIDKLGKLIKELRLPLH